MVRTKYVEDRVFQHNEPVLLPHVMTQSCTLMHKSGYRLTPESPFAQASNVDMRGTPIDFSELLNQQLSELRNWYDSSSEDLLVTLPAGCELDQNGKISTVPPQHARQFMQYRGRTVAEYSPDGKTYIKAVEYSRDGRFQVKPEHVSQLKTILEITPCPIRLRKI